MKLLVCFILFFFHVMAAPDTREDLHQRRISEPMSHNDFVKLFEFQQLVRMTATTRPESSGTIHTQGVTSTGCGFGFKRDFNGNCQKVRRF
jgi:hypothetical protein